LTLEKVDDSTIRRMGDASTNRGNMAADGTELAERS
jgi:hypothetical protein